MTDRPREDIVVGSGPAGVAAADVLLGQGRHVLMVDAGGGADAPVRSAAARLAAQEPDDWTAEMRAVARGPLRYNGEGMPLKLAFGSDYGPDHCWGPCDRFADGNRHLGAKLRRLLAEWDAGLDFGRGR